MNQAFGRKIGKGKSRRIWIVRILVPKTNLNRIGRQKKIAGTEEQGKTGNEDQNQHAIVSFQHSDTPYDIPSSLQSFATIP